MFYAVATFEGLWVIYFQTEYNTSSLFGSVQVYFGFTEKKRPNKYSF